MNKAVQYLVAIVGLGFISAAIVVFLQQLNGERPQEFLFPCLLLGGGLLSGMLAWHFGSGLEQSGICSSEHYADGNDVGADGFDGD
jgi:hypothetical protein